MLLKWKEKLGVGATYRSLAGAFHSAGRASLVGVICEVLGAEPSPLLSSEDQELNGATVHNSPGTYRCIAHTSPSSHERSASSCTGTIFVGGCTKFRVDLTSILVVFTGTVLA